MAQKRGVDKKTLVEDNELFLFDIEVEPILSVLCGKTLEVSRMEVLEEEELKEMREWLRASLDEEKEKNKFLQGQVIQMTAYLALPWWKKWNANVPLLEG